MKRLALIPLFAAVLFFFNPVPAKASDLTTGLVSCWSFDESSGTRADDYGTNDLTDNNTVGSSATAKFGNSADFERGSNEYLSITDASQTGLDPATDDITLGGWIQYESINTLFFTPFAKYQDTNQLVYQFRLWGYANQEGYVQTSANGSSVVGNTYNATNFTNWSTATWYHIMFVYDASNGSSTLFVNGTPESTVSGLSTSLYDGTAPFTVGVGYLAGAEYFDGLMDEIVFYDGEKNGAFISELYNSGTGKSCAQIVASGGGGGGEATTTPIIHIQGDVQVSGDVIMSR
jgi:large repetitive protein